MNLIEALTLLNKGKKIRKKAWEQCVYVWLNKDNQLISNLGQNAYFLFGSDEIKTDNWEEYKEPILTDKEKAYLKNVIEPLGVEVRYIKKWKSIAIEENKCCYNIAIAVKHPIMETRERDLMNFAVTKEMPFNRLELDKRYSLKDLGL